MAINIKDLDQTNDIIDIPYSRGDTAFLQGKNIYLPRDILSLISSILGSSQSGLQPLFDREIPCRVMMVDKAKWQKGKLKLTLEFIPDEPPQDESPQDELSSIRNQIDQT
jgi:hypothetical protein